MTLNQKKVQSRLWEQYLKPGIENFQKRLKSLDDLEKTYVYTLYNFITKELYTSKSGDVDSETKSGASMLWLSTLDEKREAGEIRIIDNQASLPHKANITLQIPAYDEPFLSNFRLGDVVVLYQRNEAGNNVTNQLVFKGNIELINNFLMALAEQQIKTAFEQSYNMKLLVDMENWEYYKDNPEETYNVLKKYQIPLKSSDILLNLHPRFQPYQAHTHT